MRGEEEGREEVERLEVGDKVDSDHHPVVVWMKERGENKKVRGEKERCVGGCGMRRGERSSKTI